MLLDNLTLLVCQDAILGILFFCPLFLHSVNSLENIWLTMTFNWFLEWRCMFFCRTSFATLQFTNCTIMGLGSDLLLLRPESSSLILWALLIHLHIHLVETIRQVKIFAYETSSSCGVSSHASFDSSGIPLKIRSYFIVWFLKSSRSRSTPRRWVSILLMWRSSLTCVVILFE